MIISFMPFLSNISTLCVVFFFFIYFFTTFLEQFSQDDANNNTMFGVYLVFVHETGIFSAFR